MREICLIALFKIFYKIKINKLLGGIIILKLKKKLPPHYTGFKNKNFEQNLFSTEIIKIFKFENNIFKKKKEEKSIIAFKYI